MVVKRSDAHAGDDILPNKALESLPLLNGFIKEIFRLWATLPGPLERIVAADGVTLCDVFVPPGTEITSLPYAVHRDPAIFPRPLELQPERWENESAEMKAALLTFSVGPRACPGMK
jgi:cytochrome P450